MLSYDIQKRILDVIVALILFIVFLPFWIIIPILIRLDSPGPIIFSHKRVGKNGKVIHLYKFRSMVHNADEILYKKDKELLKEFKAGDWKLRHDPRVTKIGKVLRALTIDEFPQLYNVLIGDMSMVGHRPYVRKELDEQQEKYPETKPWIKVILSTKPGITGPWQVAGRNEIPFNKRAYLDYKYARQRSILNDIVILLKTPRAMLSKW